LMFLSIQIDLIILKTYDQQFTLTTKKSLHIIFKNQLGSPSGPSDLWTLIRDNRRSISADRIT